MLTPSSEESNIRLSRSSMRRIQKRRTWRIWAPRLRAKWRVPSVSRP
jgi:hypothetical protein